jgi:hypothetical protein
MSVQNLYVYKRIYMSVQNLVNAIHKILAGTHGVVIHITK